MKNELPSTFMQSTSMEIKGKTDTKNLCILHRGGRENIKTLHHGMFNILEHW